MSENIRELVVSSNRGRYAIGDAYYGPDLTSGQRIQLLLGGHWIAGTIEHGSKLYAVERHDTPLPAAEKGYYFIADTGECCGLCCGMRVRI